MTMRQQGRNLEKKVAGGSRTVGRDVKKGMSRVGTKAKSGARTVVRDVERAGRKVRLVARHGAERVNNRVRPNRRAKSTA
jgi:hypothetical protein